MTKRASCGSARHPRPSPRSRRSKPSSPAGPRSHPTSWIASPAISRPPRRRPRSSSGHTSSCTARGRPARTVPNPQPRGSPVLPTGQGHQPYQPWRSFLCLPHRSRHRTRSSPTACSPCWSRAQCPGTALGQRDGDTPQPLQPAVIPRHQHLAFTAMGYASPFWATFHQVTAAGGASGKGSAGSLSCSGRSMTTRTPTRGHPRSALSWAVYRVQRRAARRRGHPGDPRHRAPLHAH